MQGTLIYMSNVLQKYLPEHAVAHVFELIKQNQVHLKIVNERNTRHGDYRRHPDGFHQITVNANLNKYRFLMTLIHEIAHLVAFEKFGRNIKPHGDEWKYSFQILSSNESTFNDEYFGEAQIFKGQLSLRFELEKDFNMDSMLVYFQGCSESGFCYPLQKLNLSDIIF